MHQHHMLLYLCLSFLSRFKLHINTIIKTIMSVCFYKFKVCLSSKMRIDTLQLSLYWVTLQQGFTKPAPWRATILKNFSSNPNQTPEPANQGVQGYLIITDRCVAAGLKLKSVGTLVSRSRMEIPLIIKQLNQTFYIFSIKTVKVYKQRP